VRVHDRVAGLIIRCASVLKRNIICNTSTLGWNTYGELVISVNGQLEHDSQTQKYTL
jgi:hypothetical protein